MKKIYTIDGKNFSDYQSFIKEINEKIFQNNEWQGNLDAFNDMLYGGYGTPFEEEKFSIVWKNAHKSVADLDTKQFLKWKIDNLEISHAHENVKKEIQLSEMGIGTTMFMLIIEIIASHKNIELILN